MRVRRNRLAVGPTCSGTLAAILALSHLGPVAVAEDSIAALPPAAEQRSESGAGSTTMAAPAPAAEIDLGPKAITAVRRKIVPPTDDGLQMLGGIKALDMREGEGLFRVDGREIRLRPGDMLGTDRIESIAPDRLVLLRPENVDVRKGKTVIVVELLGPGRSRVHQYASRNWTARPLPAVE